jgi:acetyl-CoA acetyltransferase
MPWGKTLRQAALFRRVRGGAMDVFVLGLALHPAARRVADKRLEEMVFDTARAALDDAGLERDELDHVTIAGCDELDGRSISSMPLAAPAGAYLRDEIKCTESGLSGLCLGAARVASGVLDVGLVVSWSKTSKAPVEDVMRMRCEPFYTRPVGLNMSIADGLFAQVVGAEHRIDEAGAAQAAVAAYGRARRNPRGLGATPPTAAEIERSPYVAAPLRRLHQAPITDGAVAMVLVSGGWLARRRHARPLARIAGLGTCTESYQLGRERLGGLAALRAAFGSAARMAGLDGARPLDVLELDNQTAYHEIAFAGALGEAKAGAVSPSGGCFAQNPYFCAGLVNAAEAVLQVSGRAGAVQVPQARRAAAHGCHGFAQQGHAVVVMEGA